MKPEQLKLYNKYKNINYPTIEFIYIGITNNHYIFLYKNEIINLSFSNLNVYGLNPDKIAKDLNLETFIDGYGIKSIKNYSWEIYTKESIEKYFKPHLKDKLKNIINR
mgnify:CR=1 FL=1